jgi:hypothetical protein
MFAKPVGEPAEPLRGSLPATAAIVLLAFATVAVGVAAAPLLAALGFTLT